MRVLLDTCVLVPNPIRLILIRLADHNLFFPLWSEKIFEEWEYFVSKNATECIDATRIEILLMKTKWKSSLISQDTALENKLFLPDENDRHVLASAIKGGAQVLLTNNLKDFPSRVLIKFGIIPRNVDSFLLDLFHDSPRVVKLVTQEAFELNNVNSLKTYFRKSVLKRHDLPRLAKAIFS